VTPDRPARSPQDLAGELAEAAQRHGFGVAVAESLTSGAVASALGQAPSAATWFRGGVVAYAKLVKYELLGVPPGPVVSATAVAAMARSTAELLGADLTVALSGVGGPGPDEGQPAGTVWFAVARHGAVTTTLARYEGHPKRSWSRR
jgi:nicotinamide-nucleotide amidase